MKTLPHVGLMLLVTMIACRSQNVTTEVSSNAWREDLSYLTRELPAHHVNVFHTVSREAFAGEVARLDAAIPGMNGDEVLVGLMRIVALVGDGHTRSGLAAELPALPNRNCNGLVMSCAWSQQRLHNHAAVGARVSRDRLHANPRRIERAKQIVPRRRE